MDVRGRKFQIEKTVSAKVLWGLHEWSIRDQQGDSKVLTWETGKMDKSLTAKWKLDGAGFRKKINLVRDNLNVKYLLDIQMEIMNGQHSYWSWIQVRSLVWQNYGAIKIKIFKAVKLDEMISAVKEKNRSKDWALRSSNVKK